MRAGSARCICCVQAHSPRRRLFVFRQSTDEKWKWNDSSHTPNIRMLTCSKSIECLWSCLARFARIYPKNWVYFSFFHFMIQPNGKWSHSSLRWSCSGWLCAVCVCVCEEALKNVHILFWSKRKWCRDVGHSHAHRHEYEYELCTGSVDETFNLIENNGKIFAINGVNTLTSPLPSPHRCLNEFIHHGEWANGKMCESNM